MSLPDKFVCPICGYPCLTEPPYGVDANDGSYEICPSCFFEYGVDDHDKGYTHAQWRQEWVTEGMPWRGSPPYDEPPGWDPREQLRRVDGR